jgi:hypothetical protein
MGDAMDALERQYTFLDSHFNQLFAACKSDEQRDQLRTCYVTARDNFWEARARVFHEGDPQVDSVIDDLKDAANQINGMLKGEKQIAVILNALTAAVHLGSTLITLGSVAA